MFYEKNPACFYSFWKFFCFSQRTVNYNFTINVTFSTNDNFGEYDDYLEKTDWSPIAQELYC